MASSWREEGTAWWGSFVFKENLKRLKEKLKTWNKTQFGVIDWKIESIRDEIHSIDMRDESVGLTEVEAIRRSEAAAQLLMQLSNRKTVLAQKAKLKWLKKGDVNSKMFQQSNKFETTAEWLVWLGGKEEIGGRAEAGRGRNSPSL